MGSQPNVELGVASAASVMVSKGCDVAVDADVGGVSDRFNTWGCCCVYAAGNDTDPCALSYVIARLGSHERAAGRYRGSRAIY